jgi:hypothetical protein
MNITPSFVFVHMPKTGGSFVSAVLRQLHKADGPHNWVLRSEFLLKMRNQIIRRLRNGKLAYEEFNKHGTCHDIPLSSAHLPILSCMRNPYDWYVSNYKYGWWRSHPTDYPDLRQDPRWPNLSFSDYLELSNSSWLTRLNPGIAVDPTLGRFTVLFVNYYCRQPETILSLTGNGDWSTAVSPYLFPVNFLDTANLNRELYDYLLATGYYSAESLAFILEKEKISPRNRRQSHEKWSQFYTPEQKADIRNRDRLLFQIFPQYDI